MDMLESLFRLFEKYDPEQLNDNEISNLLSNCLHPYVDQYLLYHSKKESEIETDKKFNKLIAIRLFALEIWEEIGGQYKENEECKYRISAIGKLFLRAMLAVDENIAMIKNGYGFAVLANVRLMIETIALAKYIWIEGEKEADRFQDYSMIQSSMLFGNKDAEKVIGKYEEGFSKDFGWMSKKDLKSIPKLLEYTKDEDLIKYYKLASHFVHSSSYSVEKALQINHRMDKVLLGYFPIGFEKTVELNIDVIWNMSCKMMEWFMTNKKEMYAVIWEGLIKSI